MDTIINILMERDGVSYDEAKEMYLDAKAEIYDAVYGTSVMTVEDVLYGELGLELDYIHCFI